MAAVLLFLPVLGDIPSKKDSYFVFENRGGYATLVSYTLKVKQEWPALTAPALAKSPRGGGGWRELKPDEYTLSADGRTRTVAVKVGESLRVAVIKRYPGHGLRGLWMFPVESIQLADAESERAVKLSLASCEALLAFERWDDGLFVFQVKRAVGVPPI